MNNNKEISPDMGSATERCRQVSITIPVDNSKSGIFVMKKSKLESTHWNVKHGLRYHPLYSVWTGMRYRCQNRKHSDYCNYGDRGIKVCEEWEDVVIFYNWAISNGYKKGLSIDRINNDGNYSPDNCRFADRFVQNNNSRNNKGIREFCRKHKLLQHYRSICRRLNNGKSFEEILQEYKQGG